MRLTALAPQSETLSSRMAAAANATAAKENPAVATWSMVRDNTIGSATPISEPATMAADTVSMARRSSRK